MPRRLVPLVAGECFHIYNRGHNRSPIFHDPADYGLFLRKFRQFVSPEHLEAFAYALLPNHYHVLGRVRTGHASRAMQRFGIALSKIVNAQCGRVGSLFQGAFRAKPVPDDDYLLHLTKYIHLNPVRAGLASELEGWAFSSYREYVGLRAGSLPATEFVHGLLVAGLADATERHRCYAAFMKDVQPSAFDFDAEFGE